MVFISKSFAQLNLSQTPALFNRRNIVKNRGRYKEFFPFIFHSTIWVLRYIHILKVVNDSVWLLSDWINKQDRLSERNQFKTDGLSCMVSFIGRQAASGKWAIFMSVIDYWLFTLSFVFWLFYCSQCSYVQCTEHGNGLKVFLNFDGSVPNNPIT